MGRRGRRPRKIVLTDEQRELVADNIGLVRWAIKRRFGSEMASDEDYVSEGYIGLCRAAHLYNSNKGCEFSTYAYKVIINRIYRLIYLSKMPKRKPVIADVSMEAMVKATEGNTAMHDVVLDVDSDSALLYERKERNAAIVCLATKIAEAEPRLVAVKMGMKQADCAAKYGISQQAVSQAVRSGSKRMRMKYQDEYDAIMGYKEG